MKKIRNVNGLNDEMDKEFSWRLKELADIKILVRNNAYPLKSSILRAGVPLAYAHWEGFVKNAVDHYLNFVANQHVSMKDLKPCLVALSKKRRFHEFSETNKFEVYSKLVQELTETPFIDEKAVFSSRVRTANLKSHIFSDISLSIGLSLSPYESRFNFIDVRLVKRRNEIAHGSFLDIDDTSFRDLVDDVISLIRGFKSDIENLAVTKAYLR